MQTPDVRYASSGDLRLAYQRFGNGPPLIVVPPLVSNMEVVWEHEFIVRAMTTLGRHVEVVQFDKRGIGLSDRFDGIPTLEERISDILAVMDAVGWERASLLGISEGGVMAQLFAVRHPERVDNLVLHNTLPGFRYLNAAASLHVDGDPPLDRPADFIGRFHHLASGWPENAEYFVDWFMPDQAGNESFVRWVSRFQRLSASPRDFRRQVESILSLDPDDATERISRPTLVIQVKGDRVMHVTFGRLLAQTIPDARYVEVPGDDHFSWALPNWRDVFDPMVEFLTGSHIERGAQRRFAAVLFTDIVGSTQQGVAAGDAAWHALIDDHDRLARKIVDQHAGRVVKSTGDGLLMIFDAPSQAVECGVALCHELRSLGITIRAGLHAGEIELHDDLDVSGFAVNLAARVEQSADDGELWVSSTVRDMMFGGTTRFVDRDEHTLKGLDGTWKLYSVEVDAA